MIEMNMVLFQILDPLIRMFQQQPQTGEQVVIETVTPVAQIIAIIVLIGGVFLLWRINHNVKAFPNDEERVGKVTFRWQGNYSFMANVSRYTEPILESTMEELKQTPWFEKTAREIEVFVKNKKLVLYQAKMLEWDDILDMRGKKEPALIISSGDIANERYSWEDKRGEFDWGTMRRERPKNVFIHESSRHIVVESVDGNDIDVFLIAPIPRVEAGEDGRIGFDDETQLMKSHLIDVEVLPQMKHLAQAVPFLIAVARSNDLIKAKNIQLEKLKDLLESRDDKLNKAQRLNDILRIIGADEPLIGEKPRPPPVPEPFPMPWLAFAGLAGILGTQAPANIPEISTMNPVMAGLIGTGAVIGWAFIMKRKKDRGSEPLLTD